ncbi:MAG: aldehyde dehydrogenase family protein [Gammaproteobacteria bacterium]|nr:aldehyde dehydrogenase family protein [Gammaproteobacteria bacterium]
MINTLKSYDPSNGELLGELPVCDQTQITETLQHAKLAAKSWRQLNIVDRVDAIKVAYQQMLDDEDKLSELLSREMGKDIRRAAGEVGGAIHSSAYLADEAMTALQTQRLGYGTELHYKALGVVAVISPWNYPVMMANNLIVPALVAGNSVILKPSEQTPLIADAFFEHLSKHLPAGVFNIIHGDGEVGELLVKSDVNLIAFTGSQAVGKKIMAAAASQVKRLLMELGGNDPMIVMSNANIEQAARFAVGSSFENAGQMCTSTERIYVNQTIADQFEQRVVAIASQYKTGAWNQPGVNIGPIINAHQYAKIIAHISDAKEKGAQVLLGGHGQDQRYIQPTVISQVNRNMKMEHEETFGPVVSITRYSNIDQAIEWANDSNYGLGAAVFGTEGVEAVASQLEAGMIGINQGPGGGGDAPWVGAKQSGFGFHGSAEGHRQFAQVSVLSK